MKQIFNGTDNQKRQMQEEINHDSQRYQHIDRWKFYGIKEEFFQ
jgi:hypothetical protein